MAMELPENIMQWGKEQGKAQGEWEEGTVKMPPCFFVLFQGNFRGKGKGL